MAKFLYKHRRGTTSDWVDKGAEIIPLEGEIVIELDVENKLHKLKIGDGVTPYSELKYLQAGDEIVTQVLATVMPRVITVELATNWNQDVEGKYSQTITLNGITKKSRLDLQPSADMLAEFKQLGLVFVTENNAGTITIYSVGNMPAKSYTMQATIVETECNGETGIVGGTIGVPVAQADWEQSDDTHADYIKNKPVLGALASKSTVENTDLSSNIQTSLEKANSALQSYTETDPTVPDWAKAPTKPTYTASEVGALPDTTAIPTVPTNISAFTNDAGYLTEHQSLDGLATENYVDAKIEAHNSNITAHNDIRIAIEALSAALGGLQFSLNENGILTISTKEE
jgi:hypothetical protein